jgi:hypothetical protein
VAVQSTHEHCHTVGQQHSAFWERPSLSAGLVLPQQGGTRTSPPSAPTAKCTRQLVLTHTRSTTRNLRAAQSAHGSAALRFRLVLSVCVSAPLLPCAFGSGCWGGGCHLAECTPPHHVTAHALPSFADTPPHTHTPTHPPHTRRHTLPSHQCPCGDLFQITLEELAAGGSCWSCTALSGQAFVAKPTSPSRQPGWRESRPRPGSHAPLLSSAWTTRPRHQPTNAGEEIARCPSCSLFITVVYDAEAFAGVDPSGPPPMVGGSGGAAVAVA